MQKNYADELNFTLDKTKKNALSIDKSALDCSFFNCLVKFYNPDGLAAALKDAAPYLKVAYVCREKDYLNSGVKVQEIIRRANNKVVTITLNNDYKLSVDSVCHLFNLGEDIRAIFTDDNTLISTALYFATVRNIPAIIYADELCALKNTVYVKNGGGVDCFRVSADRYVILRDNAANIDCDNIVNALKFFYNESTIFYKLNFNRDFPQNVFDFISGLDRDFFSLIKLIYIDFLCGGALLKSSTLISAEKLLGNDLQIDLAVDAMLYLIKTYKTKRSISYPPDYNKIAAEIYKFSGEKVKDIVHRLNEQLKKLDNFSVEFSNSCERATKLLQSFSRENLLKEKLVSGEKLKLALKHAGDGDFINFATVLREK